MVEALKHLKQEEDPTGAALDQKTEPAQTENDVKHETFQSVRSNEYFKGNVDSGDEATD